MDLCEKCSKWKHCFIVQQAWENGVTIGECNNFAEVIELKKKSESELSQTLIEKTLENTRLYYKVFEICKHREPKCYNYTSCKECKYTK